MPRRIIGPAKIIRDVCRVCGILHQDSNMRLLIDQWLMGEAEAPHVHRDMVIGKLPGAPVVTKFINSQFKFDEGSIKQPEVHRHVKFCLNGKPERAPTREYLDSDSATAEEPVTELVDDPPAPRGKAMRWDEHDAPIADARALDHLAGHLLSILGTIDRRVTKRAAKLGLHETIVTPAEGALVTMVANHLPIIAAARNDVIAGRGRGGEGGAVPGAVGAGNGVAGPGLKYILERVAAGRGLPAHQPGDEDDAPIANGEGQRICDEEAERRARSVILEADAAAEAEAAAAREAASAKDAPPSSAPHLRVVPDPAPAPAATWSGGWGAKG